MKSMFFSVDFIYKVKLVLKMQRNLYKMDAIGAWKKSPLYEDIIDIIPENEYLTRSWCLKLTLSVG